MNNYDEFVHAIMCEIKDAISKEVIMDDEIAKEIIKKILLSKKESRDIPIKDLKKISDTIFYRIRRRLSILEPLLEDKSISEIMVNGPNDVFIDRNGKIERYDICFENIKELEDVMQNIAGDVHREINDLHPIVDCRLKDGSRVNGINKTVSVNGPILTIRKFLDTYMTMDDLIKNETLTNELAILLKNLVKAGYNIFVSGGTSTGKTTFLNALATSIPKDERVIVIEDSMELKLNSIENIVHMETKRGSNGIGQVTMSDLIVASLRMRPDRIIVGEVRGNEVIPMLQAMNTGHDGSLSTGHANSVLGMLKRLETLYLSSLSIPLDAIRLQISEGIDIMVHLERLKNGKRKVVEVSEIVSYKNNEFEINKLIGYSNERGIYKTGNRMRNKRKLELMEKEVLDELQLYNFI